MKKHDRIWIAKGGQFCCTFTHTRSEYDNTVYGYLRMIILKNLPIHHGTDSGVRRLSTFEVNIGHVTIVKGIFALVELVE